MKEIIRDWWFSTQPWLNLWMPINSISFWPLHKLQLIEVFGKLDSYVLFENNPSSVSHKNIRKKKKKTPQIGREWKSFHALHCYHGSWSNKQNVNRKSHLNRLEKYCWHFLLVLKGEASLQKWSMAVKRSPKSYVLRKTFEPTCNNSILCLVVNNFLYISYYG